MLFLLLNFAGKGVANYIDTSLDWAENNEKWNSQTIRPDEEVLKESSVLSIDHSYLPIQVLKDGSPYKNDGEHLREGDERP